MKTTDLLQHRWLRSMIIGVITLMLSTNFSFGQSKSEQLDQLIGQYYEYGKFNGSVLVADQGKVVYKKGFGMANMEWDIPNQANTKHRLGSVTKQFTAMLILQLAEEGKLELNAPITKYLQDYPKANGDRITTHHLLTHSSGIPNYTSFPGFFAEESRNPHKPEAFIEKFQDMELEFEPGEKYSYSNSGYFLLGVIIEKLSGASYEERLQSHILQPLGMEATGYDHHAAIISNRATGYDKNGRDFRNSAYLDMSNPYAAGSMYSSVEDLYLWDQALYSNALLSQEFMDLYFKPYIPAYGSYHYAYGWAVGKDAIGNSADSIAVITHGGGINGFNTIISRSTSDKSLVVLLNNTGSAPLNEMTAAIRGILKGKSYDLPRKSLAYELLNIIETAGMAKAQGFYEAERESDNMELNEREMNNIGYQLMGNGKTKAAAQIFKWNMEAFPKSFNAYDSYAEALMNMGEKEASIKYYKKSIAMNPGNQNGIDMLKKMGVDTSSYNKEVSVPEDVLQSYVGRYELRPDFILTITKEGSQLKAQATGQPVVDIFPKSDKVFYLKVVAAQITFNKGANGKVDSLTLLQGGQEILGKKLTKEEASAIPKM